jgi:arsenate reductase
MTHTSITVFGIPNCDTVKKARDWLSNQGLAFAFHDFKKQGLSKAQIEIWLEQLSLDVLINRKGTTWRALSQEQQAQANHKDGAIELMLANPSLIKRPVTVREDNGIPTMMVGYKPDLYQSFFLN